ncbi:MAG TPA: hypothetical protein PLM07_18280, partial [Candidatus Rifleibacterium sp.]|nr:hypothetical protein [Candidatus Rifleibacterium sp.]
MWICLNNAFISVVSKGEDASKLCVRARRREHLAVLFPGAKIIVHGGTDYQFRAYIARDEVARVIGEALKNINYDNFKDSVKDKPLHNGYSRFWCIMQDVIEE